MDERAILQVYACQVCAATVFPRRLFCPVCGAQAWQQVAARRGMVEQATRVLHRIGAPAGETLDLASVACDVGPRVIARCVDDCPAGTPVFLSIDADGAIIAEASPAPASVAD